MLLHDKGITGRIFPFQLVDSTFAEQGFRRVGKQEEQTYQLTLQDSSTGCAYTLSIPTTTEGAGHQPITLRIGIPFIEKHVTLERLHPNLQIPHPVSRAALSKLAEVSDYLVSYREDIDK